MTTTTRDEFTKAEIEEWIALHRQKVIWLTAAKKDASYHERRIQELTEQLATSKRRLGP